MTDLNTLMTDLRAKAEAATPGPWERRQDPVKYWPAWVEGPSTHPAIPSPDVVCTPAFSDRFHEDDVANMDFIAAANPAAIFTILDALDEARGELERRYDPGYTEYLLRVVSATDQNWREGQAELATLRAEVERLTEINKDLFDGTYRIANRWYEQNEELAALRTKRHATCDQKLASLAKTLTERDAELATLRAEVEELGLANGSTQDFRPNHPTGGHAMSDSKPKYRWLKNCPPGLFVTKDGCLGFKSEYSTILPDCFYQCDAYVVKSGEYFGGGAATPQIRDKILVRWISADALLAKLGEDRKS